jgi:hypothetical protein
VPSSYTGVRAAQLNR